MSFLWGAATSSHQVEGHNHHNDWYQWENESRVEGGVRSGVACDHRTRFREDLELAKSHGLNSYRFSIEWSRLQPEESRWELSELDWYENLISECERLGLVPMVTLHHFTLPLWLSRRGGLTDPEFPKLFLKYTEAVVERLGQRVPLWCTVNEPVVLVIGQYLAGFMPPGIFAPKKVAPSLRNLFIAHLKAYRCIHNDQRERKGPFANRPREVGVAHNMLDFVAERRWHLLERLLARLFSNFYNRSWLSALAGRSQHFGVTGVLPAPRQVRGALGLVNTDFVGVNYYTKVYLRWKGAGDWGGIEGPTFETPNFLPVGLRFARPGDETSDLGWALHAKGFEKVLRLASRYGFPLYVTENGIADAEDSRRKKFLVSHLEIIDRLKREGLDIRGYFHWSLIDNFEWVKGFGPRFGLVAIDYENQKRSPRESFALYRDWIQARTD